MIIAEARRVGGDSGSVDIELTARSVEGRDEVSGIYVLDNLDHQIFFSSIPDCGATFEQTITVSQRRLPISMRVAECVTGTAHIFGPFVPADPGVRVCNPADPSPRPIACFDALEAVRIHQSSVNILCGNIGSLERQIASLRQVVVATLAAAAILVVAAVVAAFFGPIGVAIAIGLAALAAFLAAVAIGIGLVILANISQRTEANRRLREVQLEFSNLADNVRRHCCEHEIDVDLTPPGCG